MRSDKALKMRKGRRRRAFFACVRAAAILIAVFVLAGCDPGTGGDPAGPTGDTGPTEASSEGSEVVMRVSQWDKRSAQEIVSVGALTSVTPDLMVYDCRDFGIEPGSGDDVAKAVEKAAASIVEKGGGVLYFPSGRYKVESAIKIDSPDDCWLCLCGDTDGSSLFAANNRFDDANLLKIGKNNTHLSFLSFEDGSREAVTVSVEADGCSLYGCSLKKTRQKATNTCLEVSGSFDTVRQCAFWAENKDTCFVEFTKYPGRDAYGDVICDVHFGGSFSKTVLISSHDEDSSPENVTVFRNLFLLPADPMIEVRSVNGLVVANNMLDAGTRAVGIYPEGTGVFNVEIRDNYLGNSTGGVLCGKSDAKGGNISVHDNYFWTPDAVSVMGGGYTDVTVRNNYFVLSGGNAVYMSLARRADVSGNLVANIGSGSPELEIGMKDAESVIDTEGFGSSSVPEKADSAEPVKVPAVPEKTAEFDQKSAKTGDKKAGAGEKYFNVKDFGAAGDGVTDDTGAVRECFKKAKAASGTVFFPEGTYLIKETVSVAKDDSKVMFVKGAGADKTFIKGDSSLGGPVFEIKMKYNFSIYDVSIEHTGSGSCVDALYVKAFDCVFAGGPGNTAPVVQYHGSNCWTVRCRFFAGNPESYGLSYTRWKGEISINDYIIDCEFSGSGKGVLVGDGSTVGEGRSEGLKIIGNTFRNTGATQTEIYEILHVNVAYNDFEGSQNAIFLSNLGYGPDGIYVDHNVIEASENGITSGTVAGGGDYVSMVVVHANEFSKKCGNAVSEPVPFNKKMIHD